MLVGLCGVLQRNHLGIDERELHMTALSGTKKVGEACWYDRVDRYPGDDMGK